MDLKSFKTDSKLESEGVRVPLGDATLIIARLNNPNHRADFAARIRPYRGAKIPDEIQANLFRESLAEHVLLGWEHLEMDGQPFPYNKENALTALNIPDFADFVVSQANDMSLFKAESQKQTAEILAKN